MNIALYSPPSGVHSKAGSSRSVRESRMVRGPAQREIFGGLAYCYKMVRRLSKISKNAIWTNKTEAEMYIYICFIIYNTWVQFNLVVTIFVLLNLNYFSSQFTFRKYTKYQVKRARLMCTFDFEACNNSFLN